MTLWISLKGEKVWLWFTGNLPIKKKRSVACKGHLRHICYPIGMHVLFVRKNVIAKEKFQETNYQWHMNSLSVCHLSLHLMMPYLAINFILSHTLYRELGSLRKPEPLAWSILTKTWFSITWLTKKTVQIRPDFILGHLHRGRGYLSQCF